MQAPRLSRRIKCYEHEDILFGSNRLAGRQAGGQQRAEQPTCSVTWRTARAAASCTKCRASWGTTAAGCTTPTSLNPFLLCSLKWDCAVAERQPQGQGGTKCSPGQPPPPATLNLQPAVGTKTRPRHAGTPRRPGSRQHRRCRAPNCPALAHRRARAEEHVALVVAVHKHAVLLVQLAKAHVVVVMHAQARRQRVPTVVQHVLACGGGGGARGRDSGAAS